MNKIYIGSSRYPQRKAHTLRQLLENVSTIYPDFDAYIYRKEVQGEDFHVTYAELNRDVRAFATALLSKGLQAGKLRFAIIGENSYPWVVAYNSTVSYMGVAVPLDAQLPVDEAINLIKRARVDVLFYAPSYVELAELASEECDHLKVIVSMSTLPKEGKIESDKLQFNFWDLFEEGLALTEVTQKIHLTYIPTSEDLASIVFTSGTTSDSKGVMLNHRNIAINAHSCAESFNVQPGEHCLSVLPLHHTFENTVGMFAFWYLGLTICINDGLRYIAKNMKKWKIGIMMVVPAIAENIMNQVLRAIRKQGLQKRLQRGFMLSNFFLFFKQDKRRTIFKSILEQLGGELHLFVCGGAALDAEVVKFFEKIGIDCLPGYGLSEASPVLACNLQGKCIPTSVGWPVPGVSLKLDESNLSDDGHGHKVGEVLALGDNIMMGYLENEKATTETITPEGWLRTGDLGYFDTDGALHLTGRLKTMLVLSNGKKAFAEEIEMLLKKIHGVKESFVWDEESKRGNIIICCKVEVDRKLLPLDKNVDDEEISRYLQNEINNMNRTMPSYKAVTAFIWSEKPLIMTTTLKVRRLQEKTRIASDLSLRGISIQEANGMKIPADTDLYFDVD